MIFDFLSIFDKGYFAPVQDSILKRAQQNGILSIEYHNLRDYTDDLHRSVDDRPYGGGPGMVFKPEPLYNAIKHIYNDSGLLVYPSPCGELLNQTLVEELVKYTRIIFICGHYEGIDDRIKKIFPIKEISIGDYVITSGALASMVIADSVARHLPGVLGCDESAKQDSFYNGLLDTPHYTRPASFMGYDIPDVLLSGNHKEIEAWRLEESKRITKKNRPDLWIKYKQKLRNGDK